MTHAEIEDGVHELLRGTPLQQVAPGIAYRAIRNRGTLGGSLAHADPAADWVLTMVGLGATLEIAGRTGSACCRRRTTCRAPTPPGCARTS